jgi:Leucine-rich repeat (LRR) protein
MLTECVSVQLCLFKMIRYAIIFFLKKAISIYISLQKCALTLTSLTTRVILLFQYLEVPGALQYTMHDLVHELARSVLNDEDELIVIDAANKKVRALHVGNTMEQKYCRYALLTNYDGRTMLSDILPKKVRALHFSSSCKLAPNDGSFSFAMCLRILDFSECSGIILPSSTGQLNQLKCLIAPNLQNKRLPDSIVQLTKLQHLNLCGSSLMSALPESIGKLSGLIYLCLSHCSGILKVPESLGGLKS